MKGGLITILFEKQLLQLSLPGEPTPPGPLATTETCGDLQRRERAPKKMQYKTLRTRDDAPKPAAAAPPTRPLRLLGEFGALMTPGHLVYPYCTSINTSRGTNAHNSLSTAIADASLCISVLLSNRSSICSRASLFLSYMFHIHLSSEV